MASFGLQRVRTLSEKLSKYKAFSLLKGFLLICLWLGALSLAWGPCRVEQEGSDSEGVMVRHLAGRCSQDDREGLAISAETLLEALQAGQGVDLEGVVVNGDLMLDRLPLEPVNLEDLPSPLIREALTREGLKEVRVIKGPLIIRDADVRGSLATNLIAGEFLLIKGPVIMTGTTFQRSLDFSRTAFYQPIDFSGASILHEGFFIRALFNADADFEKTAFGTHSRFHKAVFGGKASFTRAGFNGLAEFLEVTFKKEAGFSRTVFKMGTGFSGSQFLHVLDFSEATFEREAYFRFTKFEGDAYFRRSTFRNTADFTQAKFGGVSDFTKVMFQVPPLLAGTKIPAGERPLRGLQDSRFQVGILILLFVFVVVFLLLFRRNEREGQ